MISDINIKSEKEQALDNSFANVKVKYRAASQALKYAIEFHVHRIVARLLNDAQREPLSITVAIRKYDMFSFCNQIDHDTYQITIDRDLSIKDIFVCLNYSLAILAEYVSGDLQNARDGVKVWKDTLYSPSRQDVPLGDMPWEKDAAAFALSRTARELATEAYWDRGVSIWELQKSFVAVEKWLVDFNNGKWE